MSGSFIIKDYAYQHTTNTYILSGQTTTGLNENSNKANFSNSPNPFISSATIKAIGHLKNATLTIYNSNGQPLKRINNISGQTISRSRDNLESGLYFIGLTEENKTIAVEKLLITD